MWPKTWRVIKVILLGLLLLVGMSIKVVVVLVCAVIATMAVLAHFVGGPRG
jgi:hypothetical protein